MKRLIVGIASSIVVLVGLWSYAWWHSPAETKQSSSAEATKDVLGSERTVTLWSTQYFTTRYPSDLRILMTNEVAHGLTTGQYLLGSTALDKTDQLAVTVGLLNASSLDDLPAVKLRQQRTDTYQEVAMPFTPPGGQVFRAVDGFELAMFWKEGSRYAGVVVSGSSARQTQLQEALETVVTNWQWR